MMAALIVVLVLAVLFVIGYVMRVMHIIELPSDKKKKVAQAAQEDNPFPDFPGFEGYSGLPGEEDDGLMPLPGEGEKERVDLVDYFADESELAEFDDDADPEEPAPAEPQPQTQQKPAPEEQQEEALYDRLCNLPVGRGFLIQSQNMLSMAAETGQRYAAAYFDYDRFRFINSLKGFSIGDYVLQKTTQEMRMIFPEGAMLTRISADHFAAVFPYSDEQQLIEYAEKLRRASDGIRGDIGSKSGLRICMGVSTTDDNPESYDVMALLYQANIARHCLKITKADELYASFDLSMIETFLYGESALEDYSENQYNDEFEVYFQPIYSLSAGRITSSESLARWNYEDNNTEEPPTADSGTLPTNNLKVIYHTFRAMSRWRREGNEVVPVMVNLSLLDLYKEDIDAFFARCLSEFQIEPKMVTVILDVHAVGLYWPMTEKQVGKLKDFGMSIAVSGIDRGFPNLDFLAPLPVRYAKLHRSVAQDAANREDRQAAVRAIIASANSFNIETVFEGVDYSTAAAWLKQAGAGLAEGAYAGLASQAEDFGRVLQDHLKAQRSSTGIGTPPTVVLDDESLVRGNYRVF